ncbi:MAG: 1-acyl-sn-glycerol-3-phosphate acyltransferase [Oscillospiraceae bacterium]|nr:1-acyl-sn-glycerol-3-phosphate acyltransferase [Oscillospiraceae bacterium]
MIFNCIKRIVRLYVYVFYRVRVEGIKNFPNEGAIVLCANHTFIKDLIFIGSIAPRKIHWMAKAELFRIPVFGPLIRKLGAFPVNRGARDRDSVRIVYKVLESGAPLGIFPEGTRVLDPVKRPPFKRGFVSFAANTGASVLPVALRYEGGPFGRGKMFSRTIMTIGEPVLFEKGRKYSREELDALAESIMSWINEKITSVK